MVAAMNGTAAVVRGHVPHGQRLRMLKEMIHRQEAYVKYTWEFPPIGEGENLNSYDDMRKDPAIGAALDTMTAAILSEPPHVEPPAKDRSALAVADWLQRNLQDIDVESALENALNAIWRGFWAQEITWEHKSGLFAIDSLESVNPQQIALSLDDKMKLQHIISRPLQGGGEVQNIPKEKVWLHTYGATRSHPAGQPLLDNIHRAWRNKDRLLQFWGTALQRFGMPFFVVQVPEGMNDAQITDLLDQFYQLRLDGVAIIPDTCAYQVHNPVQWAGLAFESALGYADSEIMRGILLTHAPVTSASGLTHVTGTTLQEIDRALAYRLKRLSRHLCNTFKQQVMKPLVRANWGDNPDLVPDLCLPLPDARRLVELSAPIAAISAAGLIDPETAAEILGVDPPSEETIQASRKAKQSSEPGSKGSN